MTQHVVPFLHTPLEAPEFLLFQRATARSGVVLGEEVTPGSSGYLISINAGAVVIDGSYADDDLVKLDAIDLGHITGTDKHYAVYTTYSYVASDPPAARLFLATGGVVPPTQPVLPAGAVKLADIFIPTSATSIASAGVRIVNVPRLWSRADTGELIDRLVMSVGNTIVYTAGTISYDDALGKLYLPQSVVIQALVSTHKLEFQNGPSLIRATVAAAPSGLTVPGTPGSRDVIVYALIDRSTPNTGLSATIKFLNRLSPGSTELSELLDPLNATKIVILGVVSGSRFHSPHIAGGTLPVPDVDNRKFLRNDPAGAHAWNLLDDTLFKGSLHALTFNSGSTTIDAAAKAAIASDLRVVGQRVSMFDSATSSFVDAVWDGANYIVMHGTYDPLATANTITLDIAKHITIKTTAASARDILVSSGRSLDLFANSATGGVRLSQVDTGSLIWLQNDGDIVIAAALDRSLTMGSTGTGTSTLSAANATASVTSAKTTGDAVSITASNAGGRVFVGSQGTIRVEGEGNVSIASVAGNTTLGSDGGTVDVIGDLDVSITSGSAGINILCAGNLDIKSTGGDVFIEAQGGADVYLTGDTMVKINSAFALDKTTATPAGGTSGLSLDAAGKSFIAIAPTGGGVDVASYDNITGGVEGQILIVKNTGGAGKDIAFTELGNIRTESTSISMTPSDVVIFVYDGTNWAQAAPFTQN